MTRSEVFDYILTQYGTEPDYPFSEDGVSAVFRHIGNRKWFALAMQLPGDRLGLPSSEPTDILNVKCDPILIGSLRGEAGFLPAYHMNKDCWITVRLDGSAPAETVRSLIDLSYRLTCPKCRKSFN